MSGINLHKLMADARTPQAALLAQTRGLVKKWEPTGLLEGLGGDSDRHGMAVILENQARQLIDEGTTTNPNSAGVAIGSAGSGEQWAGVALPLVRKVFGEIAAKEFVSIQPMNLPSGLIFFMDFKYGTDRPPRNVGDSLFGATDLGSSLRDQVFQTASSVPQGGLYGDGKFGYSINDQELIILGPAGSGSRSGSQFLGINGTPAITSGTVNFNETVTSVANFGTTKFNLYQVSMSALTRPDYEGRRAFVPGTGSMAAGTFTELTGFLPEYTYISTSAGVDWLTFVANAGQVYSSVVYHQQPTDSTRGDFEDQRSEIVDSTATAQASLGIPEIDLELKSIPIVAKTRKLKAVWTPELAQDLNAYHSVDAEAELTAMLSEYISLEIDLEILDMLIINAQTTDYWSTRIGNLWNGTNFANDANIAGQAWTNQTWFETLGQKIQKVSNKIHQLTMRGGANFVVCSPDAATVLETIPGFTVETDGDKMKFAAGVTQIGAFQNRYTVYKNPYMLTNVILLGYKGSNFLETGAVYAPYVPLVMTPLVYDPDNFTPRRGVLTRYAKKIVRPEFYGKIIIEGLSRL